ncbi:MAG: phenylalanine 4-monooxygenase [Casimicrobiaceae bacterium]|nr:phenylalanine 4-monooxygenase [Casimicrobiaceae bacterium]MDW8311430.1 phenylalanine 4-monooxygenase [Burkholderiales bacterium]
MNGRTGQPFDISHKTHNPNAGLRGDYSHMAADFTVPQEMGRYDEAMHERWRRLVARQLALLPNRACRDFIAAVRSLELGRGIPCLAEINAKLAQCTGWELVGVPGLLPDEVFFTHLSRRRFPVTVWLREEHEFDYIVEPDLFHDFFGHVPMLFTPVYADFLQRYGEGGLKAARLNGLTWLARLYWYTIEFGLLREADGVRAYGAGILSSPKELVYAVESPTPARLPFEVMHIMRTPYRIDDVQTQYFVLDHFEQLLADTEPDFAPYYAALNAEARANSPR